ncbi:chemotaxis protein CheW [Spirochaeta cellobiosiphila]|uniref:chemotaxis protein CheW n=1 Tax=Spirochaeta cellobiosiphila TaxID=504483 RepID=UPI00041935C7|nr:chemotaxis protein CheW [Spirochaeta cellobiosiphila]
MENGLSTKTSHYLTFTLDVESYAIDVIKVREVLEFSEFTRVPRMPDFMKGVINLRGSVVPIIDLRLKFGLEEVDKTVDSSIIILEIEYDDELLTVGAITDSVQEVIEIPSSSIEPAPKIGTKLDTQFIYGMGRQGEEFIVILNIDRIMTSEDIAAMGVTDQVEEKEEEEGDDNQE